MAVRDRAGAAAKAGDEIEAAREAGLRYVTDDRPGITRRGAGRVFNNSPMWSKYQSATSAIDSPRAAR